MHDRRALSHWVLLLGLSGCEAIRIDLRTVVPADDTGIDSAVDTEAPVLGVMIDGDEEGDGLGLGLASLWLQGGRVWSGAPGVAEDAGAVVAHPLTGQWLHSEGEGRIEGTDSDRLGAAVLVFDQTASLVIGAPGRGSDGTLLLFDAAPGTRLRGPDDANASWDGTWGDGLEGIGEGLVRGDLNGDGLPELIVGAPNSRSGGRVLVFEGDRLAAGELSNSWWLISAFGWSGLGSAMASGADVNGDGRDDLLVCAPQAYEASGGGCALVLGADEFSWTRSQVSDAAMAWISSSQDSELLGAGPSAAAFIDSNGDGTPEPVMGARGVNDGQGLVVAVPGAQEGGHWNLDETPLRWEGEGGAGAGLAADADGLLLFGAPTALGAGAVFALSQDWSGVDTTLVGEAGDALGMTLSSQAGRWLMVGAPEHGPGGRILVAPMGQAGR